MIWVDRLFGDGNIITEESELLPLTSIAIGLAMILRQDKSSRVQAILLLAALCFFLETSRASIGDRLPEFRECVEVRKALPAQRLESRRKHCMADPSNFPLDLQRQYLQGWGFSAMYVAPWRATPRFIDLTVYQLSTSASCSGRVPRNVITHVSISSPTSGSPDPLRQLIPLYNTMGSGHSAASWACRSPSQCSSPS